MSIHTLPTPGTDRPSRSQQSTSRRLRCQSMEPEHPPTPYQPSGGRGRRRPAIIHSQTPAEVWRVAQPGPSYIQLQHAGSYPQNQPWGADVGIYYNTDAAMAATHMPFGMASESSPLPQFPDPHSMNEMDQLGGHLGSVKRYFEPETYSDSRTAYTPPRPKMRRVDPPDGFHGYGAEPNSYALDGTQFSFFAPNLAPQDPFFVPSFTGNVLDVNSTDINRNVSNADNAGLRLPTTPTTMSYSVPSPAIQTHQSSIPSSVASPLESSNLSSDPATYYPCRVPGCENAPHGFRDAERHFWEKHTSPKCIKDSGAYRECPVPNCHFPIFFSRYAERVERHVRNRHLKYPRRSGEVEDQDEDIWRLVETSKVENREKSKSTLKMLRDNTRILDGFPSKTPTSLPSNPQGSNSELARSPRKKATKRNAVIHEHAQDMQGDHTETRIAHDHPITSNSHPQFEFDAAASAQRQTYSEHATYGFEFDASDPTEPTSVNSSFGADTVVPEDPDESMSNDEHPMFTEPGASSLPIISNPPSDNFEYEYVAQTQHHLDWSRPER